MPGDKSISHRAAMIAALAGGSSRLRNYAFSQDCLATVSCLQQLGAGITRIGPDLQVQTVGGFSAPATLLDCGNSGSTMRMLAGVLAGQAFAATLTGDESLRARPMRRIIEPLELMGARFESQNGCPPLTIDGTQSLSPISYRLPVASAQVKSSILLAALQAAGRTRVIEPTATRDHTERMLQWFGVPLEIVRSTDSSETTIAIEGPASFPARDISIPGDISSAACFIAAATLLTGSDLVLEDVGLNTTRTKFLSVLQSLGAQIDIENVRNECNEVVGLVRVRGGMESPAADRTERAALSGSLIPELIDELPLLAVLATQIEGGLEIREAAELRVKETDRIAATVHNLRSMGAEVEEYPDGLAVNGPVRLRGATIEPRGDHRIAMAFTVAALIAESDSEIADSDCVNVSFPEFFALLAGITEH
ncbi:MAG: 3-phosphoshikimate 1-carboxyvinyltransferase [Blastocatellia bacterium]|jgi:3-phosphoshikimate 1-carboxyvinyltransferase|nr:3-phosphoshikimate 1-carboxyvinyltransferase [Blastocatellia bacterium]